MLASRSIKVTFDWSGTHRWPDAKGVHSYLSNEHRHRFKGVAIIEVFHDDRELEFLEVKDYLERELLPSYRNLGTHSCEWVAEDIILNLTGRYGDNRNISVEVSEDGENGAIVEWADPLHQ